MNLNRVKAMLTYIKDIYKKYNLFYILRTKK